MPRGLRVNNPGNMRRSAEVWKGEQLPSPDTAFKAFQTLGYGYRALSLLLYNYYKKYGCNTLRKIITKYAPPTDGNDTEGYINTLASRVGISPDRVITEADFKYPTAKPLMQIVAGEIARIEQGKAPDETALNEGYKMFVTDRLS